MFCSATGYIETEEIPNKAELVRLLQWIDPQTKRPIHLPVDRTAPLTAQVYQLNQVMQFWQKTKSEVTIELRKTSKASDNVRNHYKK